MKLIDIYTTILNEQLTNNLVINITKNTEPSAYFGKKYGQDVEPKGTYVLNNTIKATGYINGKANLQNPLFINITDDTVIKYKYELSTKYKAKGQRLTNKLMKLGYDSIITIYEDGTYGEIILFPNALFTMA